MRPQPATGWTLVVCAVLGLATLSSPVGSSVTFHREVIDDKHAGDCSALADLDGNASLDILSGTGLGPDPVGLRAYLRSGAAAGTAGAYAGVELARPASGEAFVGDCPTGDIDGDGDTDAVLVQAPLSAVGLVTSPATILWLENPAPAASAAGWSRHVVGQIANGVPLDLAVADLNGDAVLEVISRHGATLTRWSSASGGWSGQETTVAAGRGLLAADVDADGDIDLLAGGILAENRAAGDWPLVALGAPSATAAVGDLDGDGRPEVVLGPFDSSGALLALRRHPLGAGPWTISVLAGDEGRAVHHLELADIEGDGDLDVLTAVPNGSLDVSVNRGDTIGAGGWPRLSLDPDGLFAFATGDLDGDGDADVVGSNQAGNAPLVMIRNQTPPPSRQAPPQPVAVAGTPTLQPLGGVGAGTDPSESTTADTAIDLGAAPPLEGVDTGPSPPGEGQPAVALADPGTEGRTDRASRPSGAPAVFGPPSVDGEVGVLPATLERTRTLQTTRLVLALAALATLGLVATGGWLSRRPKRWANATGQRPAATDPATNRDAHGADEPAPEPGPT